MPRPGKMRRALGKVAELLGALAQPERPNRSDTIDEEPQAPQVLEVPADRAWRELWNNVRIEVHETARAALMCFTCGKLARIDEEESVIREALLGNPPTWSHCGSGIDVWKNTRFAMRAGGGLALAAQVGARHTTIMYRLG